MGAISIGTTGLTASTKQMDVIGNNLANSSTLGFKSSSTQFASILSESGKLAVGQGVGVSNISTQFSQGSFENTGNATDMAIDGEGFFMIKDEQGGSYYTRAGAFHVNELGYLVDTNNYKVQGFTQTSTDTDAIEEVTDISLQNIQSAPLASTEISVGANLNEDADYGDKFNVSQPVFDTKGKMHTLSIVFQKTEEEGTWGFDAKLDSTLSSDTANQAAVGITFDSAGLLESLYNSDVDNVTATAVSGATLSAPTINRPGQLYQDATGIELTKGATTGAWTATVDGGYTNISAWQEASDGTEYLKVDLDGEGGADITFDLGLSDGDTTLADEAATVTFRALVATETFTVAGKTYTATGAVTSIELATAFSGGAVGNGGFNGTSLAGYTAAATAGQLLASQVVFTSTTADTNVADLTASGTGIPTIDITQGNGGADEAATVTFQPLGINETVTVATRTFTALVGVATAAEIATAFLSVLLAGATAAGTYTMSAAAATGYTVAAGDATDEVVFTSTTADTNVADLTATGTHVPTIAITQGGNGWYEGDNVAFNITRTDVDLADIALTFGDLGNGATIGVADGMDSNTITWDLTGTTAQTITGYASTSVIKALRDNGYSTGDLKSLAVGRDGVISGFFTNGQTSNLGQIVLADFPSTDGLMKVGSYFGATTESGGALINSPGSGSMGEIRSNSLEISNTDVAREFINMIQAQRAYQASSRVITTADQMLTELMNIKR